MNLFNLNLNRIDNGFMVSEYLLIFKFFIISFIVSLLLFFLSVFFVYQKPEKEKMSVYECGFNPFGDASNKFEVKYYIVGILFIIFDLEIMFLFLWVIGWLKITVSGSVSMFLFIFLLTLGFIYEVRLGALDLYFLKRQNMKSIALINVKFLLMLFLKFFCIWVIMNIILN